MRSVADVRWMPVWNATDEATSPVGRSRHPESESRSGVFDRLARVAADPGANQSFAEYRQ